MPEDLRGEVYHLGFRAQETSASRRTLGGKRSEAASGSEAVKRSEATSGLETGKR
jgi:hypothetical protein